LLFKNQPAEGKRVAWLALFTGWINFILSLVLGLTLSLGVYYLITDLFFVFIFNFLFCSLISVRWFDFSHKLFRHLIYRYKGIDGSAAERTPDTVFVMILGLRKSTGWGLGLVPVFIDAGTLWLKENRLLFDGVFLHLTLTHEVLEQAEPVSYERIRFSPSRPIVAYKAEAFWLVVRDQFYPFKSRDTRDGLLVRLGFGADAARPEKTPAPLPTSGTPAS